MKGYQYTVLRLVPHVDRGECVNVGVVLYCQDAAFLDASCHLDATRIAALAPDVDIDAVNGVLSRIRDLCRGQVADMPPDLHSRGQRFGWILAPRSTIIQPGPVHGGLCDDPGEELRRLVARLVTMPAERTSPDRGIRLD